MLGNYISKYWDTFISIWYIIITDSCILFFQAENTAEVKKQRYFEALEERRMKRDRLYRRLIKVYAGFIFSYLRLNNVYTICNLWKMIFWKYFSVIFSKIDDETRRAVDRITNQRRKQAEFVEVNCNFNFDKSETNLTLCNVFDFFLLFLSISKAEKIMTILASPKAQTKNRNTLVFFSYNWLVRIFKL